jgi:hypothetical protein
VAAPVVRLRRQMAGSLRQDLNPHSVCEEKDLRSDREGSPDHEANNFQALATPYVCRIIGEMRVHFADILRTDFRHRTRMLQSLCRATRRASSASRSFLSARR